MRGKTVYLRPLQREDMVSFYESAKDEEIRYMTGTRATFTMEQLYAHYEKIAKDDSRHDFAICLVEDDRLIGELSIMDIEPENQKAGFRIALNNKKDFNKGYGTEAVQLALKFVFEELKLNRLQLEVYSHNIRGIKAYEKAGFKREGVLRESLYYNNQFSDEIIMGMLRKDYEELKKIGQQTE